MRDIQQPVKRSSRAKLFVALVFVASFVTGWASAPAPAECRMCRSKTCSSDRSCGEPCKCVWENGKTYKRGKCMQIGD